MKVFERTHFFTGKLLTAEDLSQEQQYQIGKRRLHNRMLHGWGLVSGLEVMISDGGESVRIEPGVAIDCEGNEIILPKPYEMKVTGENDSANCLYAVVAYEERMVSAIDGSSNGDVAWDRIVECFAASLAGSNSNAGHRHQHGRWLSCGQRHPITLARLRRAVKGWRVDRRYHPPRVR
jgi:hypothetical protein